MNTKLLIARRLAVVTVVAAVFSLLAYGVGWAVRGESLPWDDHDPAAAPAPTDARSDQGTDAASEDSTDDGETDTPGEDGSDASDDATSGDEGSEAPSDGQDDGKPSTRPEQDKSEDTGPPPAGPALYSAGDRGPEVREVQARLKQIDWFSGEVTNFYGDLTTEAVRGFQAKRGFEATGEVDQRTLDRLEEMTREPTPAELTNRPPGGDNGNQAGALDPRCETGRVLCIDKSSRTLRWVVDGQVRKTVDVRFGSDEMPTRDGQFSVTRKSRDHVSSIYHTPMPFAMFFSGGQAVHYSSDFAARGYNGASHGCVNVRDRAGVAWIYDQAQVGDKVIVYWS